MVDKSSMLFISIVGIMTALALSVSNIHAVTVNNTDFSIEVPNGWVYREDFLFDNGILLTPNEFADVLITDNASALLDGLDDGVMVELAPEVYFPIKNAPVELYAKHVLRLPDPLTPTYENATIGGERAVKVYINFTELVDKAIKVYINSTELALATGTPNVTSSINSTELALATGLPSALIGRNSIFYFVMHDDQPYYLNYIANAKDFEKYLPEFEQMLKTFKFTK